MPQSAHQGKRFLERANGEGKTPRFLVLFPGVFSCSAALSSPLLFPLPSLPCILSSPPTATLFPCASSLFLRLRLPLRRFPCASSCPLPLPRACGRGSCAFLLHAAPFSRYGGKIHGIFSASPQYSTKESFYSFLFHVPPRLDRCILSWKRKQTFSIFPFLSKIKELRDSDSARLTCTGSVPAIIPAALHNGPRSSEECS